MARDKTAPKKPRWYHQIWEAYRMTREVDPSITWVILAIVVGVIALGAVLGLVFDAVVYFVLLALPFAFLGGMFVLARRAESAAYSRIAGQPGASIAALRTIRRGWSFGEEPVAVDPRTQDLVFRGIGRAGVVLVGEGPKGRVDKLLESERKRTTRVISGAPVILLQVGDAEGQVPLPKIARTVQKLKPKLTKQEVAEVSKRLTALGGVRMPVPKGVDPMRARPDRKGMRGR